MLPLLLLALIQGTPIPAAEMAYGQAQADWWLCLEAEARRSSGSGRLTEAAVEAAFPACRAGEAMLRERALAAFGADNVEPAMADARARAPRTLVARSNPGTDPLADANRGWGNCLGTALREARGDRRGRSDSVIVDSAFAACGTEERAFRAALASHYEPAIIDDAIATVRAQTLADAPRLLAPPRP